MDLEIKDKVFLVAASSKGLGYGVAEALSKEGARVSLASRTAAEIETAAESLREGYDVEARGYVMDATNPHSIAEWISASLRDFGQIDGLVVNAGGPPAGGFESFADADWESAFQLTLLSAVRMIRGVMPELKRRGGGSILTVTSSSVREPIEGLILSNVFRAGVSSLVKSVANEVAQFGIRVNNLVPGRIDTDRVQGLDQIAAQRLQEPVESYRARQERNIPLGRYGTPPEFGAAAAFLLSERASYMTGSTVVVDGGKIRSLL
jgi:3-oxoacyl-[acyl-carrier protein] reductase